MRGTVHGLGLMLLLSGSLGLFWMFTATLQLLGQALHPQPVAVSLSPSLVAHGGTHERTPFPLMPLTDD